MLVAAMRRNEVGSFREFFERFVGLITRLARAGCIPREDRDESVTEFLDDAALRLSVPTVPMPRSLAAYLATSFLRRRRNGLRDRRCRERLQHEYAVDVGGGSERVVAEAASEDSLRTSRGPEPDEWGLPPAVERLAVELERGLTDEERQLLAWLAERVPQRLIATWLGVTHGAVRVRVVRLRARLADAAMRYAHRLDGPERAELERFFRRMNVSLGPPAGGGRSRGKDGRHRMMEEKR